MYHGYRFVRRRHNLKKKKGYVIPATSREDSGGVDFWVKVPGYMVTIPVQITQRGVRLFRKHNRPTPTKLKEFIAISDRKVRGKRMLCMRHKVLFVLVRDYDGDKTNPILAKSDVRALRWAVARYRI